MPVSYFCGDVIRSFKMTRLLLTALSLVFLIGRSPAAAQVIKWPNPEVEQLYRSAQASLAAGAYKQAIASYQQALIAAPGQMVVRRDLAQAFLLSGSPLRAQAILDPLIDNGEADASTYAIAATAQTALREDKKARKLLDKGIEKYPNSGFLYHEKGKYYENTGDMWSALKQWTAGIGVDPAYHLNYYEAARGYMQTTTPVWAIIYGEIFINLERPTPRSAETRKLLLSAYKRFYATPDVFGGQAAMKSLPPVHTFEDAVTQTLMKLSPVLADGVTTENLTMLRTRFSMDWTNNFADKYPFTLFRMFDELLREGHFDAYNQWVFGRVENGSQYEAWLKFHPEAMPEYEAFYRKRPLLPTASDAYNTEISKRIFPKRK